MSEEQLCRDVLLCFAQGREGFVFTSILKLIQPTGSTTLTCVELCSQWAATASDSVLWSSKSEIDRVSFVDDVIPQLLSIALHRMELSNAHFLLDPIITITSRLSKAHPRVWCLSERALSLYWQLFRSLCDNTDISLALRSRYADLSLEFLKDATSWKNDQQLQSFFGPLFDSQPVSHNAESDSVLEQFFALSPRVENVLQLLRVLESSDHLSNLFEQLLSFCLKCSRRYRTLNDVGHSAMQGVVSWLKCFSAFIFLKPNVRVMLSEKLFTVLSTEAAARDMQNEFSSLLRILSCFMFGLEKDETMSLESLSNDSVSLQQVFQLKISQRGIDSTLRSSERELSIYSQYKKMKASLSNETSPGSSFNNILTTADVESAVKLFDSFLKASASGSMPETSEDKRASQHDTEIAKFCFSPWKEAEFPRQDSRHHPLETKVLFSGCWYPKFSLSVASEGPIQVGAEVVVLTPSTSENVKKILDSIGCEVPLLLEGATGVGKTRTVLTAASVVGQQVIRFNMSEQISIDDMLGKLRPNADVTGMEFKEGPFTHAFRLGFWLLIDEINLAEDKVLQCIENALEFRTLTLMFSPTANESSSDDVRTLGMHPNFRLFATQNPNTGFFSGKRQKHSQTFLSRFQPISFGRLPRDEWVGIVERNLEAKLPPAYFSYPSAQAGLTLVSTRMVDCHFGVEKIVSNAGSAGLPFIERGPHLEVTVRDLLKWTRAVALSGMSFNADGKLNFSSLFPSFELVYALRVRNVAAREELIKAARKLMSASEESASAFGIFSPGPFCCQFVDNKVLVEVGGRKFLSNVVSSLDINEGECHDQRLLTVLQSFRTAFIKIFNDVHASSFLQKRSEVALLTPSLFRAVVHDVTTCKDGEDVKMRLHNSICNRMLPRFRNPSTRQFVVAQFDKYMGLKLAPLPAQIQIAGTPFALTPRTEQMWNAVLFALFHIKGNVLLVGPPSCGKSSIVTALASILLQDIEVVALNPESEPSALVGSLQPKDDRIGWVDGAVSRAVRSGRWLLLDNLSDAPSSVLERLNSLLEEDHTWVVAENGETTSREVHPNFRVIATMSTPLQAEQELSPALYNRFVVINVASPQCTNGTALSQEAKTIAKAYIGKDDFESDRLQKTLETRCSLFENPGTVSNFRGFCRLLDCVAKVSQADPNLRPDDPQVLWAALRITYIGSCEQERVKEIETKFEAFLAKGSPLDFQSMMLAPIVIDDFILDPAKTKARYEHAELITACILCDFPVLLEGPPSVGKTAIIHYLQKKWGEKFTPETLERVNNTENTTLQEYLGSFLPSSGGSLLFCEGALVRAMRSGSWFLADEFNLAEPSVMAVLAPLLEGSRQLFVPALGQAIEAHPNFRFFATQNPSSFAGRKELPISLRSRFVEAKVSSFGIGEIAFILTKRKTAGFSAIDFDIALKLEAMSFRLNESKTPFQVTFRELIKILRRKQKLPQSWVDCCLRLLTCRCPTMHPVKAVKQVDMRLVVTEIIQQTLASSSSFSINDDIRFKQVGEKVVMYVAQKEILSAKGFLNRSPLFSPKTQPPQSFLRALISIAEASVNSEPILLIGPTSCKTLLIETFCKIFQRPMSYLHLNGDSEVSDILGQIQPYNLKQAVRMAVQLLFQCLVRINNWFNALKSSDTRKFQGSEIFLKFPERVQAAEDMVRSLNSSVEELLVQAYEIVAVEQDSSETDDFPHGESVPTFLHERVSHDGNEENDPDDLELVDEPIPSDDNSGVIEWGDEAKDDDAVSLASDDDSIVDWTVDSNAPETLGKEFSGDDAIVQWHDIPPQEEALGHQGSFGPTVYDKLYGRHDQSASEPANMSSTLSLLEQLRGDAMFSAARDYVRQLIEEIDACEFMDSLDPVTAQFVERYDVLMDLIFNSDGTSPIFLFRDGLFTRAARLGEVVVLEDFNAPSQSVTERLNSALETERTLNLVEDVSIVARNASVNINQIRLLDSFLIFATIHAESPHEDLHVSPATRSRFTEIWVDNYGDDVRSDIIAGCIQVPNVNVDEIVKVMVSIVELVKDPRKSFSIVADLRTLKRWAEMIAKHLQFDGFEVCEVIFLGALYLLFDQVPWSHTSKMATVEEAQRICLSIKAGNPDASLARMKRFVFPILSEQDTQGTDLLRNPFTYAEDSIRFNVTGVVLRRFRPFFPAKMDEPSSKINLISTPSTVQNMGRIFSAMMSGSPLLLEGPPGVGKTRMVEEVCRALGFDLVRINFTSSTTVEDLIGRFVPSVNEHFERVFDWKDGKLLKSLKKVDEANGIGAAILFDEINLASPELLDALWELFDPLQTDFHIVSTGESVQIRKSSWKFKLNVFATMNPASVGGNRNALPRSVLSQFVRVKLLDFSPVELEMIVYSLCSPLVDNGDFTQEMTAMLLSFHRTLDELAREKKIGRKGGVSQFNLRDLKKVITLIAANFPSQRELFARLKDSSDSGAGASQADDMRVLPLRKFVKLVYLERLQSKSDRERGFQVLQEKIPAALRMKSLELSLQYSMDINFDHFARIGTIYVPKSGRNSAKRRDSGCFVHDRSTIEQLEMIAAAVSSSCPILLEGPTCSRKTSVVKELASICNQELLIVNMNQDTDTGELIGSFVLMSSIASGFEFIDSIQMEFEKLLKLCWTHVLLNPLFPSLQLEESLTQLKKCSSLISRFSTEKSAASSSMLKSVCDDFLNPIIFFCRSISKSNFILERTKIQLGDVITTFEEAQTGLSRIVAESSGKSFKFVESAMVTALRKGQWVLLDNCNLASPEILERLNSLLEDVPSLGLYESGTEEVLERGKGLHNDSRIFLTADGSRQGANALSAAVLNRVIVIYLPAIDDVLHSSPCESTSGKKEDWSDLKSLLLPIVNGVMGGEALVETIMKTHGAVALLHSTKRISCFSGYNVTFRTLRNSVQYLKAMCKNGFKPIQGLVYALFRVYVASLDQWSQRLQVVDCVCKNLRETVSAVRGTPIKEVLVSTSAFGKNDGLQIQLMMDLSSFEEQILKFLASFVVELQTGSIPASADLALSRLRLTVPFLEKFCSVSFEQENDDSLSGRLTAIRNLIGCHRVDSIMVQNTVRDAKECVKILTRGLDGCSGGSMHSYASSTSVLDIGSRASTLRTFFRDVSNFQSLFSSFDQKSTLECEIVSLLSTVGSCRKILEWMDWFVCAGDPSDHGLEEQIHEVIEALKHDANPSSPAAFAGSELQKALQLPVVSTATADQWLSVFSYMITKKIIPEDLTFALAMRLIWSHVLFKSFMSLAPSHYVSKFDSGYLDKADLLDVMESLYISCCVVKTSVNGCLKGIGSILNNSIRVEMDRAATIFNEARSALERVRTTSVALIVGIDSTLEDSLQRAEGAQSAYAAALEKYTTELQKVLGELEVARNEHFFQMMVRQRSTYILSHNVAISAELCKRLLISGSMSKEDALAFVECYLSNVTKEVLSDASAVWIKLFLQECNLHPKVRFFVVDECSETAELLEAVINVIESGIVCVCFSLVEAAKGRVFMFVLQKDHRSASAPIHCEYFAESHADLISESLIKRISSLLHGARIEFTSASVECLDGSGIVCVCDHVLKYHQISASSSPTDLSNLMEKLQNLCRKIDCKTVPGSSSELKRLSTDFCLEFLDHFDRIERAIRAMDSLLSNPDAASGISDTIQKSLQSIKNLPVDGVNRHLEVICSIPSVPDILLG
jgi:MoxR-like ATPase